jgi:hypothetical protein
VYCFVLGKTGYWRRKSESNRRPRLCRPLHNHSAIPPIEIKTGKAYAFPVLQAWSGKRVSNSRPQPWQGCALPTELFPRFKEGAILRIFGRVSTAETRTIFRAFAARRLSDSKPLTAMSKMRRHKSLLCLLTGHRESTDDRGRAKTGWRPSEKRS